MENSPDFYKILIYLLKKKRRPSAIQNVVHKPLDRWVLKQSTLIHGFMDLIGQTKSAKPRRQRVAESSGVTGNLDKTLLDKNNS